MNKMLFAIAVPLLVAACSNESPDQEDPYVGQLTGLDEAKLVSADFDEHAQACVVAFKLDGMQNTFIDFLAPRPGEWHDEEISAIRTYCGSLAVPQTVPIDWDIKERLPHVDWCQHGFVFSVKNPVDTDETWDSHRCG